MKPWLLVVLGIVVGVIAYKMYLGNKVTTAVTNATSRMRPCLQADGTPGCWGNKTNPVTGITYSGCYPCGSMSI